MSDVSVRVLGPLEWITDGEQVELGGRKRQIVLAGLLVSKGHRARIDWLVDAVWPAQPPTTAAKQVRNSISELRASIAPSGAVITAVPEGYQLTLPAGALDLDVFERLVDEAADSVRSGDFALAARELRQALSLWRGPVLANLSREAFPALVAALEDERLSTFEQLADVEVVLGTERALIREMWQIVADNPFHEGMAARLMMVLHRAGMRHRALTVYRDIRDALASELGLEPGIALQRAHHEVLAGTFDPDAPDAGDKLDLISPHSAAS